MKRHGEELGVRTTVDVGARCARIRLQGQCKHVYQMENHVRALLHRERETIQEEEKAVLISQLVRNSSFDQFSKCTSV